MMKKDYACLEPGENQNFAQMTVIFIILYMFFLLQNLHVIVCSLILERPGHVHLHFCWQYFRLHTKILIVKKVLKVESL